MKRKFIHSAIPSAPVLLKSLSVAIGSIYQPLLAIIFVILLLDGSLISWLLFLFVLSIYVYSIYAERQPWGVAWRATDPSGARTDRFTVLSSRAVCGPLSVAEIVEFLTSANPQLSNIRILSISKL